MPPFFFPDPIPSGGGGCLSAAAAGPVEVSLDGFGAAVTRESYCGSRSGKAPAPIPFERAPAPHGGRCEAFVCNDYHVHSMVEEEF